MSGESGHILRYPRPAELERLGRRNAVVESSAGTGKTFLLEHLFVDLILSHGLSCDEILVVTFTEKATAELVLRLRGLLHRLAYLRADDPMAVAARNADPSSVWIIDSAARARLTDSLLGFDRATISTIHGFCQRILHDHAFVQARFFDEEVVAKQEAFGRAFREVLRTSCANAELTAALSAWLSAGHTIAELELLLCSCDDERQTPISPSFEASRMQAALAAWQRVGDIAEIERCLRQARVRSNSIGKILDRIGRIAQVAAAADGDSTQALVLFDRFLSEKNARDSLDYLIEKLAPLTNHSCVATLADAVRAMANSVVPLEALLAQRMLPVVRERAAADKRRKGRFDFSDMLALVARALADREPGGRALGDALRRRYRHALIDEFQDTDEIQWSIFQRIFAADAEHALTVIGDPKQAIYAFRGADVRAYLGARRELVESGAARVVLDRNFRSTPNMVAATNALFDQDSEFFRSGSGIRYDEPVRCGRPELVLDGDGSYDGKPIVVLHVKSDSARTAATDATAAVRGAIVEEIAILVHPESPLRLRDARGARAVLSRSIFVLTFTNAESRAIGRALRDAGIAHAFYKLGNLFASEEAEEILALLRAVAEPDRRSLRAGAFLTRFFDMDVTAAAAALDLGSDAPETKLLFRFASLARSGDVPGLFTAIVDESGLVRRELCEGGDERTITNVTHVLEILQGHWAHTRASLPELVDLLAAYIDGHETLPGQDGDLQRLETDKDAVQILTVHKAKGLEADVVFLYGGITERRSDGVHLIHEDGRRLLHIGRLTGERRRLADDELDDERSRLLYVALTRARYRLYLPHYDVAVSVRGPYRQANQRLTALLGEGDRQELFALRDVAMVSPVGAVNISERTLRAPYQSFAATAPDDVAIIRSQRSGFLVTSYSALKRARNTLARHEEEGIAVRIDSGDHPGPASPQEPSTLAGGAATGIFLHDLLATAAFADLVPDFERWFAQPSVKHWLNRAGKRHGRLDTELELAARLVHRAYTSPVTVGDMTIPTLASPPSLLRETEFLFPIPGPAHPLLSRPSSSGGRFRIDRGAVRGFIDLVFEHAGRIVVCDWKSDDLVDFSPATLAEHCREHYEIQAHLYILAALRLFAIVDSESYERRFGGMLFCFLRGLPATGENAVPGGGVHLWKPAWSEIGNWERSLADPSFWEGVR